MWQHVKRVTGEGDAYEYEAGKLLSDALWPPDWTHHTRSQLKVLDDRLGWATLELSKALKLHPDFRNESPVANWPEDDAVRIAKVMHGLEP